MPGKSKSSIFLHVSLALVVGVALFWPIRFKVDSAFWERLMDGMHLPLFFAVTLWLEMLWPKSEPPIRILKIALTAIAIAGLVELIQPLTGRSDSIVDFRNGILGAVLGAITVLARIAKSKQRIAAAMFATIAFAAASFWPAFQEWQGIQWRHSHFPLLGDFEATAELRVWTAQGGSSNSVSSVLQSSEHPSRGQLSLKVSCGAGSWAGVSFAAGGTDWSSHSKLIADLFNPADSFTLGIRVDDDGNCSKYGQRFDRELKMTNGLNHLLIFTADLEKGPSNRKLNLHAIHRLALFTGADQPARTFFLDNVRLE
jgi:hypothetical protein